MNPPTPPITPGAGMGLRAIDCPSTKWLARAHTRPVIAVQRQCNRVNEHRWEQHRKRLRPRGGWQWVVTDSGDIEVVEQHFRDKPEISGTARKIAESLELDDEKITSLRLGGIVGHHEVIFGFPNQTMRLVHESIRREAFGTGAAYALEELAKCNNGFYSFEDLLMRKIFF